MPENLRADEDRDEPPLDTDLIERYLASAERGQRARRALEQFAAYLYDRPLHSATTGDLRRWWADHVRDPDDPADPRPWSVATGRRKRSYLRDFFVWADETGWACRCPFGPEEVGDAIADESRDLIRRFLNFHRQTFTSDTAGAYRGDLEQFARWLGPGRSLSEVRLDDVTSWFNAHTRQDPDDRRPWSRVTARRKLSVLRKFYRWARKRGIVDEVPLEGYAIDAPDTDEVPTRLTPDGIAAFFDFLERRIALSEPAEAALYVLDMAIFRMCYNWALRVSEAVNLRTADVRRGEGGEREVRIRKKGKKVRAYPLTGAVDVAYRRWWAVRQDIDIHPEHRAYLFVHPVHGRHVTRKRSWERFRKLGAAAGLDEELPDGQSLHPHLLRHAMGYRMAEEHGLQAAQSVLDHANIRTTNVYVRDADDARRRALREAARK